MAHFNFINRSAVFIQQIGPRCILQQSTSSPLRACTTIQFYSSNPESKKPKRPVNTFITFWHGHSEELKRNNPGLKMADMAKLVSENYRELPETKLKQLKEVYNMEMEEYKQKLKEWELSGNIKESKDLNKPKKPLTPYAHFVKERFAELTRKREPNMQMKDNFRVVTKQLSDTWKTMSEYEKQQLKEVYDKEMEEYKQKLLVWKADLSVKDKREMKKELKLQKKESKDLNKPEKPLTVYSHFVKERFAGLTSKMDPNMPYKDKFRAATKQLSETWRSMPEDDKQIYRETAQRDSEEYSCALEEWEQERMNAGQHHLVRKSFQKKESVASKKKQSNLPPMA